MFTLEIAHPNNAVQDEWTAVEEFSSLEELPDLLEMPPFVISPYLCVRVCEGSSIEYTGIYREDCCIDVGPSSEFCGYNKWDYDGISQEWAKNLSFIDRWRLCKRATPMVWDIFCYDTSRIITKTILQFTKENLILVKYNLPAAKTAIWAIESWLVDGLEKPLHDAIDAIAMVEDADDHARDAIYWLGMAAINRGVESDAMACCALAFQSEYYYAERLRAMIPFDVICEAMLK